MAWWIYPVLLFIFSFFIGIISVLAGIGGGSIYVPLVVAFFPFNFDLIRGSGLFLTLGSSLSAIPQLLKKGFADIRLAIPFALTSSIFSIIGANISFTINERILKITLGIIMVVVSGFMILSKGKKSFSVSRKKDFIASALKIGGVFKSDDNTAAEWSINHSVIGIILFAAIGIISGMFGIGGGWAGVPTLNLLMGAPLKLAAGTSSLIISANSSSAIWVYIAKGAVFPLIAVPSFLGIALGSKIGAKLMGKINSYFIKWIIIIFLACSGIKMVVENIL